MAEGFETPEHRVHVSVWGGQPVPDFSGWDDRKVAHWWDGRLPGTSIGKKLLARGEANWMAIEDMDAATLQEEAYGLTPGDALKFCKVVQKSAKAYVQDAEDRRAAHTARRASVISREDRGGEAPPPTAPCVVYSPYPTAYDGVGEWQPWEQLLVLKGTVNTWLVANELEVAVSAVNSLFKDVLKSDPDDVMLVSGMKEKHNKLLYGVWWHVLSAKQKGLVPADITEEMNGLKLAKFVGVKCHGDQASDLKVDMRAWARPDGCKSYSDVPASIEKWSKLYAKLKPKGTDYSVNETDFHIALDAIVMLIEGVKSHKGESLMQLIVDEKGKLDKPDGWKKIDVPKLLESIVARAKRLGGELRADEAEKATAAKAASAARAAVLAKLAKAKADAKGSGAKQHAGPKQKSAVKVTAVKAAGVGVIENQCYQHLHSGVCTNPKHAEGRMSPAKYADTHRPEFAAVGIPEYMKKPCDKFSRGQCKKSAQECRYSHAEGGAKVAAVQTGDGEMDELDEDAMLAAALAETEGDDEA